jgi:hypothetical protein
MNAGIATIAEVSKYKKKLLLTETQSIQQRAFKANAMNLSKNF